MNDASEGHRQQLLDALRRFVTAARQIAGVRRIAVLGSIVTTKPDPKDIDVLVVVADDADLTSLATLRTTVARPGTELQSRRRRVSRRRAGYVHRTNVPLAGLSAWSAAVV
jgi:hypothetical protein